MELLQTSRLLSAAYVAHGFSLRAAGDLRSPESLAELARAVGVSRFATARQVHQDRVVGAREGDHLQEIFPATVAPPEEGADAVVALDPTVAAGVFVADCVPVLLFAEDTGGAAAVHSGWRGTRLSIAARGVRALQHTTSADPRQMLAAVGPSIGRCCYEVSRDLARAFRDQFGEEVADDPEATAKPHLDLRQCVEKAMLAAGVPAERIEQVPGCTACDEVAYFSFRRDHDRAGRHLCFISPRAP
jgi:YfiH family protein